MTKNTASLFEFMEPAGSIQINKLSEEYQRIQFQIQSQGQLAGYYIDSAYSLRTPRHAEQFNRACNDQKPITLYIDLQDYCAQNKMQLEDLLAHGFDNVEIFDGLNLESTVSRSLRQLKNTQLQYPAQVQISMLLECQVAVGTPIVVEDQRQQTTKQNLLPSYDSFAVIPAESCVVRGQQIQHQNMAEFAIRYVVFSKERILPVKLIVVKFDSNIGQMQLECQVCRHCVTNKLSRQQYFGKVDGAQQPLVKPNLAEVFCKNDEMVLCRECDRALHVQLLVSHVRTDISHQTKFDSCTLHPDQLLKFYDQINKRYYCQKCLTGQNVTMARQTQNILNLEEVYFEIQKDLARQTDVSDLLAMAAQQQATVAQALQKISSFSASTEQLLVGYFKQMVQNLQATTQLFTQQVLGQDVEVQRQAKLVSDIQRYLTEQKQNMSTNGFVSAYNVFKQLQSSTHQQLMAGQDCAEAFANGIKNQIQQFETQFKTMPDQHMAQMKAAMESYSSARLFGVFGRTPRQEPLFQQAGEQNQIVFRQLQQQKVNGPQKMENVMSDSDILQLFNAVSLDDKVLGLTDYVPGYQAVRQRGIQMKERQQLEEQQKLLETMAKTQAAEQTMNQKLEEVERTVIAQKEAAVLTNQEREEMISTVAGNRPVRQPKKQKQQYLDQIFGDKDQGFGAAKLIHGLSSNVQPAQAIGQQQTETTDSFFENALRSTRRDVRPKLLEEDQQPAATVQRLEQEPIAFTATRPAAPQHLETAAELMLSQQLIQTQPVPQQQLLSQGVQQVQVTFEQMGAKLQALYKIQERTVNLPSQVLQQSGLQKPVADQVLLYSLHALAKQRGFSKLKLLEPVMKFSKKTGQKFAQVVQQCGGRPMVCILGLAFAEIRKQIVVIVVEDLEERMFEDKWNGYIDINDNKLEETSVEIAKKYWKVGEQLYIYKDFAGVEYQDKAWNVDTVEIYGFEWK